MFQAGNAREKAQLLEKKLFKLRAEKRQLATNRVGLQQARATFDQLSGWIRTRFTHDGLRDPCTDQDLGPRKSCKSLN
jgi:hypothetical protein